MQLLMTTFEWKQDKVDVFQNCFMHHTWNETNKDRVCMFVKGVFVNKCAYVLEERGRERSCHKRYLYLLVQVLLFEYIIPDVCLCL